jgi:hypothetical protein
MFESLTDRLNTVFENLRRHGKLSEEDVDRAMLRFINTRLPLKLRQISFKPEGGRKCQHPQAVGSFCT